MTGQGLRMFYTCDCSMPPNTWYRNDVLTTSGANFFLEHSRTTIDAVIDISGGWVIWNGVGLGGTHGSIAPIEAICMA